MGNVWKIARKEFADLLSNTVLPVILLVFFFLVLSTALRLKNYALGGIWDERGFIGMLFDGLFQNLRVYGGILAVLIGFYSISSEKIGNALNTMIAKPIYRDTIINGKMIGCALFLSCIFAMATMLYTSLLLVFIGEPFAKYLPMYLQVAGVILALTLVNSLIYLGSSMLISLLVKNRGTALLSCAVFFVFVSCTLPGVNIAGYINKISTEPNLAITIIGYLSPDSTVSGLVYTILDDYNINSLYILSCNMKWIVDLLAILVVILVANYIVFIRRDIS